LNKLQIKINIRDEEINKFQKMIDNYEENIINIRREYDLKLNQRDNQIKNYTQEIDDLNSRIKQDEVNKYYLNLILGCSRCWK
jgi:hypothetical protein